MRDRVKIQRVITEKMMKFSKVSRKVGGEREASTPPEKPEGVDRVD